MVALVVPQKHQKNKGKETCFFILKNYKYYKKEGC